MRDSRLKAHARILAPGLIVIALAGWWLYSALDGAWQELALMRHAETRSGFIVDTWEEPEERDGGGLDWYHYGEYTYRLTDGREFTGHINGPQRLKPEFRDLSQPYPIEVEYLPDDPTVSRIKGDGPDSIPSWLRTEVGYRALWPLLLLALGIYLFWSGVRELSQRGTWGEPMTLSGEELQEGTREGRG